MRKRGKNKRAISHLVVTIIVLALSLVAIGVAWAVISGIISRQSGDIDLSKLTTSADIKAVHIDESTNNISILVRRNPGEGELVGYKVVFNNATNSEIVSVNASMKELDERMLIFNLLMDLSTVESITLVPLIKSRDKEVLGSMGKTYKIKNLPNLPSGSCTPATCASLGYNCDTHANGTCAGTLNCGTCSGGQSCVNGVCTGSTCTPATCAYLSRECGSAANGTCPGTLNCGMCGTRSSCNSTGTCVCNLGWSDCNNDNTCECNSSSGYCDGVVCSPILPSCTPATCASLGYNCDTHANGTCAGTLNCGTCGTGYTCSNGNCVAVTGNVYYVRPGAIGRNDGSDWANAYTNIPAGKFDDMERGATYYIADGDYPTHYFADYYRGFLFDDSEDGTKTITIKKATASDHGTSTGWQSTYGDGQAYLQGLICITNDRYIFDGATRNSDWKSGYGIKVDVIKPGCSNEGYPGLSDHLLFKNMEFYGKFTGSNWNTAEGDAFYVSPGGNSNLTIRDSYLHDYTRTLILTRGVNGLLVENNYFARQKSSPWGEGAGHGEPLSDMSSENVILRYNVWEDPEGTGVIVTRTGPNTVRIDNWEIYGNVIWWTPSYNEEGVSAFVQIGSALWNTKIYNNIIYNGKGLYQGVRVFSGGSYEGTTTQNVDIKVYNNLWWNCPNVDHGGTVGSGLVTDYNFYYNSPPNAGEPHQQIWTGGNIFVNPSAGNFHLNQATAAGITLPSPYNKDKDGNTRGSDGVWDRGAYEYSA
jgi:hypothetical protein